MFNKNKNEVATTEKVAKKPKSTNKSSFVFGIMGIGLALTVISIAYSTLTIFFGLDGLMSRIMIAPQAMFDLVVLFYATNKVFK